ncbi:MAG: hypothetical protein ACLQBD_18430, partial [Syntrophobacteraceae bacterium]
MNERKNRPQTEAAGPGQAEESALASAGTRRPKRVPLGHRDRLKFRQEPGYHYHLFNDVSGGRRILQAIEAGYEFVYEDPKTGQHTSEGTLRTEEATQMGASVTHP